MTRWIPDTVCAVGLVIVGLGIARWNITAAIIYAGTVLCAIGAALAYLGRRRT